MRTIRWTRVGVCGISRFEVFEPTRLETKTRGDDADDFGHARSRFHHKTRLVGTPANGSLSAYSGS